MGDVLVRVFLSFLVSIISQMLDNLSTCSSYQKDKWRSLGTFQKAMFFVNREVSGRKVFSLSHVNMEQISLLSVYI